MNVNTVNWLLYDAEVISDPGIIAMLDAIGECDNITELKYANEDGEWYVTFAFCDRVFMFVAADAGDGFGPCQDDRIFSFDTGYDVMFWISCALITLLDQHSTQHPTAP